ncbi:transmembrane protein 272-like [Hyperolius riggenbachi]|uniref:transmembrane protein 272-like n=1 Tax=Hyperolius riggenbachi TaxID=752182 RepID=UPI0035A33FE0
MDDDDESRSSKGPSLISVIIWTPLSIAMIVLGSLYIDQCPIQPLIPIFLIVAGAVHLLGFVLMPLQFVCPKVTYTIEGIVGLFSLSWFIAGSVWVFSIYQTNPKLCHDTLYKFAFGILIFEYIFICIAVVMICLFTCCFGFMAAINAGESTRNSS